MRMRGHCFLMPFGLLGVFVFGTLIYLCYLLQHIAVTEKFNTKILRQEKIGKFFKFVLQIKKQNINKRSIFLLYQAP